MAGTKAGGLKASETNKKLHGSDFYAKIGAKGGRKCCVKGFGANPELAKIAGAKGGAKSHRGISQKYVERIKEARKMYDEGVIVEQIAAHFGVSASTVYHYLSREI